MTAQPAQAFRLVFGVGAAVVFVAGLVELLFEGHAALGAAFLLLGVAISAGAVARRETPDA
jgi:hypothetical protein